MKFILGIVAVAVTVAFVSADVSHLNGGPTRDYLPPFQNQPGHPIQRDLAAGSDGQTLGSASVNREYLPPTGQNDPAPAHSLGADGYHYKTPENNHLFF